MAKLSTLTDYYEPETLDSLPVDNPYTPVADPTRIVPVYASEPQAKPEKDAVDTNTMPSRTSVVVDKILNKLFRDDDKRYQLWPEKVVREALTGAGDVASGKVPTMAIDPETGDVHTSPQMIEKAQAISALAGSGGLGGVTDATLGATPFLRPALKYKDKLYKGKEGQQHMDVIPEALYPEFQKMAMSGEDISHYNFGFVNDKGHFLDREKALKYAIDTGMVDKFAGQYGALTSTLLADSTKPGMAIEAMAKANPFFSAVEHNVAKIPQTKMTGDQWLGTLSNKPGVKPEELDWTGIKSFLEENKGKPVTKAQIEEHLAANKVELKEISKGTGELHKAAKEFNAEAGPKPISLPGRKGQLYADEIEQGLWDGSLTPKDLPTNLQPYAEKMLSLRYQQGNPTKYHSYQLPGGENYREMLLTLPKKDNPALIRRDQINKRLNEIQNEFDKYDRAPETPELKQLRKNLYTENQNLVAEYNKLTGQNVIDQNPNYKSSHWDEPNILAHVRMNDRDVGGKKSLHLEEIQSDWHQQGRDRGYKQGAKEIPYVKPDDLKLVEGQHDWMVKTPSGKEVRVGKGVTPTEIEAKDYLVRHINKGIAEANSAARIAEAEKLPDAPFKKTWHELALKRMIREAAEKGYDRLSWTPGEAQAARYDLSKQLKELQYLKNEDGTYSIAGVTKDGGGFNHPDNVPANKLPDIVGKEMAEKIIKNEGRRSRGQPSNGGYFEGVDLKIGGEGMKGFYDQIIPKALEKLGKEHGVKVQKGSVATGKNVTMDKVAKDLGYGGWHSDLTPAQKAHIEAVFDAKKLEGDKAPIHYIDLPQSLKDQAIGKGFPLFSNRYMFTPVDYEPEFK